MRATIRACLTVLLLLLPALALAQDRPKTILVLDASGSMWGQIDGTAKITIAQEVIGRLLETLPADQQLGLTAYGHRRKGDCADIETLAAPGAATRDQLAQAVNGITPRGKTPLSDAVVQAAEALKYTEEAATVVLVSDGRETCEADPCAVGRTLEESGVDFTVHVVGFDVEGDPEALGQLQCLAEETGGRFLTAANAEELGEALEVVAEPETFEVTLRALNGDGGPEITDPLVWEMTRGDETVIDFEQAPRLTREVAAGDYQVSVLRPSDEASASATATVEGDMVVTLVLPAPLPEASLDAPDSAPQGSTIDVGWEGPGGDKDYVGVSSPDGPRYINYTYIREGNPVALQMPPDPGPYELRYFEEGGRVLATRMIDVTPVEATVEGPESAPMGATVEVRWSGPDYRGDYVSVAAPDDPRYVNYRYTADGDPAQLRLPPDAGTYELRYVMTQGNRVLARQLIEVTQVDATLEAPESAPAGATLDVGWTGPDYDGDYVSVALPDEARYITYRYTRDGTPAAVKMPPDPGTYELRYVMTQGNRVLARRQIEVVALSASLDAPAEADAGATLQVGWTGPDYKGDYIAISKPGDDRYETYSYTRDGSPLGVRVPLAEGEYELRYVMTQGNRVLARQPLEVVAVGAKLTAPGQGDAGAKIVVGWEGPDYKGDYIAVARPDQADDRYVNYSYAREGAPLLLTLPPQAGAYELRYVAKGDGTRVLARQPIEVGEVRATIEAPDQVPAGGNLALSWEGPDYEGDFIALVKEGETDNRIYQYTAKDSPMVMQMPEGPGMYELRYIMGQGRRILGRKAVELTYRPSE